MIGALNTAATGMATQERQIESISNNLANVSTTGYKKSRSEFQDLLYETIQEPGVATSQNTATPTGIQRGSGARQVATQKIMSGGAPKVTQRELDVAIDGDGFFMVQTPSGQRGYTRDGAFKLDATGRLVNASGFPIEPAISIPPNAGGLTIAQDGTVSFTDQQNQLQQVGQLQLATFINAEGLKAMGGGLYSATPASGPETPMNPGQEGAGVLLQHHLEASNVNAVEEMVNMISAQRGYELNSKVINAVDQMLQATTNLK